MLSRAVAIVFSISLLGATTVSAQESTGPNVTLNGYYRVRPFWLKDPDLLPSTNPNVERYIQHRFRIEPHLFVNEYISAHAQVDALDDQIWGANPGNVLTQSTADRQSNVVLKRAYAEIRTAFGLFRVGRMGSHWGRGLVSNDGNGFRNEFGDAHFGDTYDRILFATKPLGEDGPLTAALLYDKIVETEYSGASGFERVKGDVEEYGVSVNYQEDWLTAGIYTLYRLQGKTNTSAWIPDFHAAIETEKFHWDIELAAMYGETEGITAFFLPGQRVPASLRGNSAIPQSGGRFTTLTVAQPQADIRMLGGATEIGYRPIDMLDLALEVGYASGDDNGTDAFSDGRLSAFSFDPDYNVGLLMFEYYNQVRTANALAAANSAFANPAAFLGGRTLRDTCVATCAEATDYGSAEAALQDFQTNTAPAFVPTNGAVRNALYFFPKVRLQPIDDLKFVAGVLWAKSMEPVATRQVQDASGTPAITETDARSNYGIEFDFSVSYAYTENFFIGLQAGYFNPGAIFERPNGDAAPDAFAIQPRLTVTF